MEETKYTKKMKNELERIDKLANTPVIFQKIAVDSLKSLINEEVLSNTAKVKISNTVAALNNVSSSSIKASYEVIYNLSLVLAVSALEATLQNFFTNYVTSNLHKVNLPKFSLSTKELIDMDFKLKDKIAKIVLEKDNGINFQNIESIVRTFKDMNIKRIELADSIQKKASFYLTCRNAIVHASGHLEKKYIERLDKNNSNFKGYSVGDEVKIDEKDWNEIKEVFIKIVHSTTV